MLTAARAALLAGLASGLAALGVFLALHAAWVAPAWETAPFALPFALAAGALAAWALAEVRPALPSLGARHLAFLLGAVLCLAPAEALVLHRGAIPEASFHLYPPAYVARLLAELMVGAFVVGALGGYAVARRTRAALACGVAGAAFAFTLGHNVPFFGAGDGAGTALLLVLLPTVALVLVLVEGEDRLRRAAGAAPRSADRTELRVGGAALVAMSLAFGLLLAVGTGCARLSGLALVPATCEAATPGALGAVVILLGLVGGGFVLGRAHRRR